MKTVVAPDVFTVAGLLTPDECAALVVRGEALGFTPAPVRAATGATRRTDIRDNDRAAFTDPALAAWLWDRCRPFVPSPFAAADAAGLDPDFRVYRYDPGQRFNRHKDGHAERPGERTRLTGLVYLNDDFTGGETAFYAADLVGGTRPEVAAVVPVAGSALFFRHDWWHEGRAVTSGRKYVLRTDVFYRDAPRPRDGVVVAPTVREGTQARPGSGPLRQANPERERGGCTAASINGVHPLAHARGSPAPGRA